MPGIYNTLSIAKRAISAQQLGLNVSGHNISNVNNAEFSRQRLPMEASIPTKYAGQIMGTGVDVENVNQIVNQYMEYRLTDNTSEYHSLEEQQSYMSVFDSLLNENQTSSVSSLISKFFTSWQDLSNNPGGVAERIGIIESGNSLSKQLNDLDNGLSSLQTDLTREIEAGVSKINSITSEIASVNQGILSQELAGQKANDLRDKRTALIRELGSYIDVKTFEQPSGSTIVTTTSGFTLVYDEEKYNLNTNGEDIVWEGSYGNQKNITEYIKTGKLGGWLEMRDVIIPKFRSDLESMTREMIWQTNLQHSQGAGVNYFDIPLTGTYKADESRWLSTLDYGTRIDYDKDFQMWVKDARQDPATFEDYGFDMGISTADISNFSGTVDVAGGVPPYKYEFTVVQGGDVNNTASTEDPVILWEKFNNEGIRIKSGYTAIETEGSVTVDDATSPGVSFNIDSGKLVAGNMFSINTNDVGQVDPAIMEVSRTANTASETYSFKVVEAGNQALNEISGEVGIDPITIEWSTSKQTGTFTLTPKDPYHVPLETEVDGMKLIFDGGTMLKGDIFVVTSDSAGTPTMQRESDYKWTLDTFRDEVNKNVHGVRASVNTENQLVFEKETDGFEVSNIERTGEIHLPDTRVSVKNHSSLTAIQNDLRLTRDGGGVWTLSGITEQAYMSASIVPPPLNVSQAGGAAAALNATYTFDVTQGGVIGTDIVVIDWSNDQTGATGTINLVPPLGAPAAPGVDGMDLDFAAGGRLYQGDSFTMNTDAAGNATVDQVPHDEGFGIDLTGNGISDIDVDFVIPVQGQGSMTFDIVPDEGKYSYSFSDNQSEDSGILAAAGVNTFFQGNNVRTIEVNPLLSDVNFVAAAQINAGSRPPVFSDEIVKEPIYINAGINDTISFTEGDSGVITATIEPTLTNGIYATKDELDILTSDIERALEDASYYKIDYEVTYNRDKQVFEISQEKGFVEKEITIHWNNSTVADTLGFTPDDDKLNPPVDAQEGLLSESDNSNALDLSHVQDLQLTITQWAYSRDGASTSEPVTSTLENYYHGMVRSLGVVAVSVDRGVSFSDSMVQRLTQDRDTISGVSLDEEMINIMKYQHAYTVASKLLTVSDEMLQTLVNMR
jgi:flagellar hook-associated protein FlgK